MIDAGEDIYLVDVREPNEFEIVSIPGAMLIPKDEILNGHGARRAAAGQADRPLLQDRRPRRPRRSRCSRTPGFSDAVHVGGGVVAWVNQIDTSLPTY